MPAKIHIIKFWIWLTFLLAVLLPTGLAAQVEKPPVPVSEEEALPAVVEKDSVVTAVDSLSPRRPMWSKLGGLNDRTRQFFQDEEPRPLKAMGLSLALPGLGQVYNGKHWKVPVVYAGIGGLGYAVAWNTKQYRRFKTAYIYRLDGLDETVDEFVDILEDDAIKNIRDNYRNDLELAYIGLTAFYILNAADAFVDAHLSSFNINDDLSIRIKPSIESAAPGIAIGLSFH